MKLRLGKDHDSSSRFSVNKCIVYEFITGIVLILCVEYGEVVETGGGLLSAI